MGPSFDYMFGKAAGDEVGRWVQGAVVADELGYRFTAELCIRLPASDPLWHRSSVCLEVRRPFNAVDFAAFLRLVSSGTFETATPVLGLYETNNLDPSAAGAIFNAIAVWIDPWDHTSLSLLQDLVFLGNQLELVSKREELSLASARSSGRLPHATDGEPK